MLSSLVRRLAPSLRWRGQSGVSRLGPAGVADGDRQPCAAPVPPMQSRRFGVLAGAPIAGGALQGAQRRSGTGSSGRHQRGPVAVAKFTATKIQPPSRTASPETSSWLSELHAEETQVKGPWGRRQAAPSSQQTQGRGRVGSRGHDGWRRTRNRDDDDEDDGQQQEGDDEPRSGKSRPDTRHRRDSSSGNQHGKKREEGASLSGRALELLGREASSAARARKAPVRLADNDLEDEYEDGLLGGEGGEKIQLVDSSRAQLGTAVDDSDALIVGEEDEARADQDGGKASPPPAAERGPSAQKRKESPKKLAKRVEKRQEQAQRAASEVFTSLVKEKKISSNLEQAFKGIRNAATEAEAKKRKVVDIFPADFSVLSNAPMERVTFAKFGLNPLLLTALEQRGIKHPTNIQNQAISRILNHDESVRISAETGSGKTLAYLLPITHKLKLEEEQGAFIRAKAPRALVLAPTRLLALQITSVAKWLSHSLKFRSASLSGGDPIRHQREALQTPLDLVIATPNRLLELHNHGDISLADVRYLVLDEADGLLDKNEMGEVLKALNPLRERHRALKRGGPDAARLTPLQVIAVCASRPQSMTTALADHFDLVAAVESPSLHYGLANLNHQFIRVVGPAGKLRELVSISKKARDSQTMIFCQTLEAVSWVYHRLKEMGVDVARIHAEMDQKERKDTWSEFAEGHTRLLVCTDLIARGLDAPKVEHVVLFSPPHNHMDYVHRAGRVGRMGRSGVVTTLYTNDEKPRVMGIKTALREGKPLGIE